nr:helicase C-terminal domain-containing protein [Ancylothrix sp. D3o]
MDGGGTDGCLGAGEGVGAGEPREALEGKQAGVSFGDVLSPRHQGLHKEINDIFQLGSSKSDIIALCSDAMSEGVNLQQASAVIQLDMPSVIRLAEQRIGRIDRMDSPFSEIEAWWPQDSDEFALRSSEQKFLQRHQLVTDLLGSNLPLPEDFSPSIDIDSSKEPVKLEEIINQVDNEDKQGNIWQLGDVFDPVRALVEGKRNLIAPEVYKQVIRSKNRSVLSVVKADYPWAFFAIAGTEWGAPRWVYLDDVNYVHPITDLQKICENLRKHLYPLIEEEPLETAHHSLQNFIKNLIRSEEQLLPKKKQRALQEMREVLQQYESKAKKNNDGIREGVVKTILSRFEEKEPRKQSVDLSLLAESWLDLIRPWWLARLNEPKRSEPLRLKDIRQDLIENPLSTEQLNEILKVPDVKPLDERIVAAIIGIS